MKDNTQSGEKAVDTPLLHVKVNFSLDSKPNVGVGFPAGERDTSNPGALADSYEPLNSLILCGLQGEGSESEF